MEVRVQGSSYGGGGEGLNELNEGVLCCVSQFLSYSSAVLAIMDTHVTNFLGKRKQGHLYRQLVALVVDRRVVVVRVFCPQAGV
jgi:hypothetical protein